MLGLYVEKGAQHVIFGFDHASGSGGLEAIFREMDQRLDHISWARRGIGLCAGPCDPVGIPGQAVNGASDAGKAAAQR